jgi:hypothetical protein
VFFWFIGTSVLTIWYVFGDPRFDYRLLVVGSVLPPAIDVWFGGARAMHSLTLSVALMVVVMLATIGRRPTRRTLLGLPLGTLLHLVFTAAWADTTVFWWPFSGGGFDDAPLPIAQRGWWNLALEIVGALLVLRIWRQAGLSRPEARSLFRTTGQLRFPARATG